MLIEMPLKFTGFVGGGGGVMLISGRLRYN